MRYALARYQEYRDSFTYRIYITDSLYYLGQNKSIGVKYIDVIRPKQESKKTGDEIALEVIEKAGLRIK